MKQYRIKTADVWAEQWTGDLQAMHRFAPDVQFLLAPYNPDRPNSDLIFETASGTALVRVHDYIVKDADGKFHHMSYDSFQHKYEEIS